MKNLFFTFFIVFFLSACAQQPTITSEKTESPYGKCIPYHDCLNVEAKKAIATFQTDPDLIGMSAEDKRQALKIYSDVIAEDVNRLCASKAGFIHYFEAIDIRT